MTAQATQATSSTTDEPATVTRLLQRQILPSDGDTDVLPLYADPDPVSLDADGLDLGGDRTGQLLGSVLARQSVAGSAAIHPDQVLSRTSLRLLAQDRISFGTYFNAFAASYWRRYTVVSEVTLAVTLRGEGAGLTVYKSTVNGRSQRVDSVTTESSEEVTFTFDLTLKPFVDGGWYWYDVVASDHDVVVVGAEWSAAVPAELAEHGTVDIAITTMNRPDFCARLLRQIGEDDVLRPYLDTVMVMEQGTDPVADSPEFPAARDALGGLLRVIEQGNLGGSGGYARGQLESVRKGTATYALMMDDDVVCEPEGILRSVIFGDLAKVPTIVGGHMFSLYARTRLHSFGEVVQPWRFWWGPAPGVFTDWDFAARNLRSARWMHKRVDVDYNGWFMCLIPRVAIEEIGLSLPLFLKWDDSEYGLRAQQAGYPTVTLPGSAVWHVPWTDKNDAVDWQSYFHQRNRFVAALLHSSYPRGGRMVRESLNHQIGFLVSMRYSTVEIRHRALLDVLEGPEKLHEDLPTRLGEIRALAKQFTDARLATEREAFPPVRRTKPPRKGRDDSGPSGRWSALLAAGLAPLRQLKPARPLSRHYPEAEVKAMDAQWWRLARYDSAVVSMNDGTSAALHQRDPAKYRELLTKTIEVHARLAAGWPALAERYRAALPHVTSAEAWDETFRPWTSGGASTGGDGTDGET